MQEWAERLPSMQAQLPLSCVHFMLTCQRIPIVVDNSPFHNQSRQRSGTKGSNVRAEQSRLAAIVGGVALQVEGKESSSSVVSAHSVALCCSRVSFIPPQVR